MAAKHIREDMYFNSQPHKEADTKTAISYSGSIFQLTASQGG